MGGWGVSYAVVPFNKDTTAQAAPFVGVQIPQGAPAIGLLPEGAVVGAAQPTMGWLNWPLAPMRTMLVKSASQQTAERVHKIKYWHCSKFMCILLAIWLLCIC